MTTVKDNDGEATPDSRIETIAGLAKGLAIIELFGAGFRHLTVADAARETGATRAAARRCLLTLTSLSYLEHDGKLFRPKARLRRLGGVAGQERSLADLAQPVIAGIREKLNESVALTVLDGRESLCIVRSASSWVVSTGVQVGGRLPSYCSATGRVLLGGLDDLEVRNYLLSKEIKRRTAKTVVDPERLFEEIVATRHSGVNFSDEEIELGLRAMAIPIKDASKTIIAAMSVSSSSARVSIDTMRKDYLPVLRDAAIDLQRLLLSDANARPLS